MTEPEQQAIAQLKQGDPAGLTGLVKLYQVRAVHAALLIVRDQGVAEQIVQDAFLQAYRKIEQFDERRPFGPWFLRSVIHAALKTTAREARFEPLEEPDGDGAARSADGSAAWWMDPDFSPPERAEQAELRKAVWQALGQLTPDQRAAVVLRYFLDESESEMIRDLDRPPSTVKWWLHAARKRLRQLLLPFYPHTVEYPEVDHEEK